MSNDEVRCFLLTDTGRTRRTLRRYASRESKGECGCPHGYHNADAPFDDVDGKASGGNGEFAFAVVAKDDPRWPKKCEHCPYEFTDADEWQLSAMSLMQRSDTGEFATINQAPVGAMWWADWLAGIPGAGRRHAEAGNGPHLIVNTPGGHWDIDSKSSNGDGWERSGEAPNVTARPSILIYNADGSERYHGWLTDGVLRKC